MKDLNEAPRHGFNMAVTSSAGGFLPLMGHTSPTPTSCGDWGVPQSRVDLEIWPLWRSVESIAEGEDTSAADFFAGGWCQQSMLPLWQSTDPIAEGDANFAA